MTAPSPPEPRHELLITATGPDRLGLVGELSGVLHDAGANLADSRMIHLRGQFSLILLAEMRGDPSTMVARLEEAAASIGLRVSVTDADDESAHQPDAKPYRLTISAMDQPGIVHRVTNLLRPHGVNIEELETRRVPATYSGAPLFSLDMSMTVPRDVSMRKLRAELESLCDELNCDVDVEAIAPKG
jgi:glycine cleavage system transcriptional repressor